jgi:FixJ family two-component response regulator
MNTVERMPVEPLVHLVDNDPHVLKAVARLLESAGIRTQANHSASEFLTNYDPSVPGCLVLDLAMPGENGLDLQRVLLRNEVPVPIVFLSGCADVPASVRAMKEGAIDFLTKPVDGDELIAAVQRAIALDGGQRQREEEDHALHERLEALTPREREILPFLVSGKLNKQIAGDLGVVEKTVKVHRAHVMHKLGVRSLADLVRFTARLEITPPGSHHA